MNFVSGRYFQSSANAACRVTSSRLDLYFGVDGRLIRIGFLNRTPRGRTVTHLAYEHFGLRPGQPQNTLF